MRAALETIALLAALILATLVLRPLPAPVAAAGLLGVYLVVKPRLLRRPATELGRAGAIGESARGILVGVVLCLVVVAVLATLGVYRVDGTNPLGVVLPAVGTSLFAAVSEELVARGVLFTALERATGGVFGFEGSVVSLVVCLVTALWLWRAAKQRGMIRGPRRNRPPITTE